MNNPTLLQWYKDDTGFTDEQIATYRVGYCPGVPQMIQVLFKDIPGISQQEIKKLELDNTTQFNDALIYPVLDVSGHTARIYTKPLHPPPTANYKYLGTSNAHPLFRKDLVYGLYQIRKALRATNYRIILCEGFKASIAAGAIAVMGTAVTDDQLALLKSVGIRTIITCFDGDNPGYIASIKVVEEIHRFRGLIIKIAQMPLDTQCDMLVKAQGKAAFDAVINNAKLPIEFLVSSRYDLSGALSLEAKYNLLADVAPIVSKMNEAEIDITSTYLASILGVTDEGVRCYIRDVRAANSRLVNTKAEEAVLYYTVMEPTNWARLKSSMYTAEHFSFSDHQKIFTAIEKAYLEHATAITARAVSDKLAILYPQDIERLQKRIDAIVAITPEYSFEVAASTTLDLWRRRATIVQTEDLKATMQDLSLTPMQALHKFRRQSISSLEITDNQACEPVKVAEKVDRILADRQAAGSSILGFDFSAALPGLNAVFSGIQQGHYYVIAANQSVGKSSLALNIVNPIAVDLKVPTLWIPQEMPEEDITMRLYSIRSGVNNNIIQTAAWQDFDQYLLYQKARDDFAKGALYFRRPVSGDIDEIYAIIEEYKFKYGIKVVVWDYIQLIQPTRDQRGMSDTQVIANASNIIMQRVVGTLGLAAIVVAQLNREDYKEGEIRKSEKMGGAYKVAQDATDTVTIAEKSEKQIKEDGIERGNRLIYVDKRRGGASDKVIPADYDTHSKIDLRFREKLTPGEYAGFGNIMGSRV
jgi:DNA primase